MKKNLNSRSCEKVWVSSFLVVLCSPGFRGNSVLKDLQILPDMRRYGIHLFLSGLLWPSSCSYMIPRRASSDQILLHSRPHFLSSASGSVDYEMFPLDSLDTRVWPSPNSLSSNTASSQRVTLTRYLSGLVQDQPEVRDCRTLL
jgi:hypothetical protein